MSAVPAEAPALSPECDEWERNVLKAVVTTMPGYGSYRDFLEVLSTAMHLARPGGVEVLPCSVEHCRLCRVLKGAKAQTAQHLSLVPEEPAGLTWEAPPPAKSRTDNTPLAEALAQRLDEWAVVRRWPRAKLSGATSWARHLRSGAHVAFATVGDFEAVARVVGDEARVYARCTKVREVSA